MAERDFSKPIVYHVDAMRDVHVRRDVVYKRDAGTDLKMNVYAPARLSGEARVPDGRFKDSAAALSSFRKLRSTMLEQARTSQEDYRGRKLTDGNMDVYQWFLMISSHSQRHILQIREVKGAQGFPKR
jgi:hypothetical protein